MIHDFAEYDPFEPRYSLNDDGVLELDSEPMTTNDWLEWLDNE